MYPALIALLLKFPLWQHRGSESARRPSMSAGCDCPAGGSLLPELHINGKWLAHSTSGTARYAAEMVRAIAVNGAFDLVVHVPSNAGPVMPAWTEYPWVHIRRARSSGVVFEQCHLPAATFGRRLLNFTGSAPLFKRRQLVTMLDAAPFRRPLGFSRAFVKRRYLAYWWLGRVADGLATVSTYSAHELSDVLRVDVDRFIVAAGSADELTGVTPVRPELDVYGDHYLIIGTGARHENVCPAVAAITASGRKVVLVGMSAVARRLTGSAVANGNVVVAEGLTDAELVWLYCHSRALVLPSTYESFALPVLEAQVLGCPVVCSDSAALPEVCRDGALYFDPDDPEMLLVQLDRIESEIGLGEDLRQRGLANAQRCSWHASAQQILSWVGSRRSG